MPLRILAIEPYYGLSHRAFLEGYQRFSTHSLTIWKLPPRKWKWRMHGAAIYFAEEAGRLSEPPPDLILASDFLNVAD